eukprot:15464831-Alexandrium_andersonii.AAC.1
MSPSRQQRLAGVAASAAASPLGSRTPRASGCAAAARARPRRRPLNSSWSGGPGGGLVAQPALWRA